MSKEITRRATKILLKYRIIYLFSLITIPSVFYFVSQKVIGITSQIDSIYSIDDLTSLFLLPIGLMFILLMYCLIDNWIEIEQKFHAKN